MENLIHINNGDKMPGVFTDREMTVRIQKLRALLSVKNIDAALFTSYHGINYFSGFLYCCFGRPYGLVVTDTDVTSISANIDGGQPARRTFGGGNIVYTDWQKDNYYRAVKQLLQGAKTIGIEFDHVTLEVRQKLEAALPGVTLLDISTDCMTMRMIKSDEEIALITQGARIADIGGQACVETVRENIPEVEVVLASTNAMVREIAKTYPGSEIRDTWTWFQSGINTDGAHNPVTTRKLQKGDILSLNCFPMIAGYYTALERTLFFDHIPNDRALELWSINVKVHERGLQLIRPGVRCSDIAKALNEIYREHDLLQYRTFGYGHSFGVLSHYYGREAGLELREDIDTVIKPGMVISMEPMIMIPEGMAGAGGYREHDILVVTETGTENITHFPYGPEHNIIQAG